ncbi:MAG: hypothetical protein WCK18_20010 [Prolixibacteraceae bacterium]
MNEENLTLVEINSREQQSDEAKVRAVIKKYNFHSKEYLKTEWWDRESD